MKKRMLINVVDPEEIRVAITGPEGLEELYLERTGKGYHAGNIYKGKVQNIEPSLQAAFVDIGGGKNAFLHVRDIIPPDGGYKGILKKRRGRKTGGAEGEQLPIEKMLWKGQELLVQITRESFMNKGPSVTTYISLPGRYLVLMPAVAKRGVSKKIRDAGERQELRMALDELDPPPDKGFIIRTAGMGKGKQELKNDLDYLLRLWKSIENNVRKQKGPSLLYEETDLVIRAMRDFMSDEIKEVLVDGDPEYKRMSDFLKTTMPGLRNRARMYQHNEPMFVHFGLDKAIDRVFARRVPLESGGEVVVDTTEAMVAIDVNSGKFRKAENSREMILKINLEAARVVARQLRLRDLGGLVMVDFIDMEQEEDRRKVETAFREALSRDRARMTVLSISPLGVLEMTRQRVRQSLRAAVYTPCQHCAGTGMTKSCESIGLDVLRALRRKFSERQGALRVRLNSTAAIWVNNHRRLDIAALEKEYTSRVFIEGMEGLPADSIELDWLDNGSEV